jgi:hypothetical protein
MVLLNNLLSRFWNIFHKTLFFIRLFITISILYRHFLPNGEPISAHLLRCGGFAVDNHSFTYRRLVTAPSSTREYSRLNGFFIIIP